MNKFVALIAVLAVAGASSAFAGAGCCPASKAKSQAAAPTNAKLEGCAAALSKLNLSAEQKAKADALLAQCQKEKCSDTAQANFAKGLKEILTPEQYAQCQELCAKEGKGTCAMTRVSQK